MSGFIYNDISTADILDTELVLVSTDGMVDSAQGVNRELKGGDPTITRPIVNEYGTLSSHLQFQYALMKIDGTAFTMSEQITVERWLTSPKFSSKLILTDCYHNPHYKYLGKFTETSWIPCPGGFSAVNFTFSVNGSYAYETYRFTATTPPGATLDMDHNKNWSFYIDCITDELEEWVYPRVTIKVDSEANSPSFTITNNTDDGRQMIINTTRTDEFVFDCKHCMLTGDESITLEDISWADVGNIYWLRLRSGSNYISVVGDLSIKIEYDSPVKVAGGWLV